MRGVLEVERGRGAVGERGGLGVAVSGFRACPWLVRYVILSKLPNLPMVQFPCP